MTERQRKGVPDGKWTFSSGFLYSLTVITTIGELNSIVNYVRINNTDVLINLSTS